MIFVRIIQQGDFLFLLMNSGVSAIFNREGSFNKIRTAMGLTGSRKQKMLRQFSQVIK